MTFILANKQHHLSSREMQILNLISYEYTTDEIACILFLSPHTIESHKKSLRGKMSVKSIAGLIRKGFELGLLEKGQRQLIITI